MPLVRPYWRGRPAVLGLLAMLLVGLHGPAADAATISNVSSITITVTEDPFFVLGTILGKVFHDPNGNGRQDPGEAGLSGVRLAMEDGTAVVTDPHGRYSIPGVLPGQHLLVPDLATLPPGSTVTTDRARYIKMSDALLARANFGVTLPAGAAAGPATVSGRGPTLQAQVVPESELPEPLLILQLERAGSIGPSTGGSQSATPASAAPVGPPALGGPGFEFTIRTNYPDFIQRWRLLILDDRDELRRFEGSGAPPQTIAWDGRDQQGLPLARGRRYEAALEVLDRQGRMDRTTLTLLAQEQGRVADTLGGGPSATAGLLPHAGTSRRAIPLDTAAVVTVRGVTEPSAIVTIRGQELIPDAMGQFAQQFIVPTDITTVTVEAATAPAARTTQTFPVSVSDHSLFLIALGEAELGRLKNSGRLEAVGPQDRNRLEHALYAQGRLAYYLKAKIRGKYLITSSYDMDRERKALFRQLDEDEFYPVYGDSSTLSLDATDTQGKLYLLIEADKSYAQWGTYGTGLTGTQLANYNRTLHGGKVHWETLATTPGGEPTLLVTVFTANARQLGAHDELQGTGGTRYYLRQQDVVEGSEKLTLEIRDHITREPLERRTLVKGQDYDIDYAQGRLRFYRPVASIADGTTLATTTLLNGHPVFIVADYEFRSANPRFQEQSVGGRVSKALGDRLVVGGTYVKQEEDGTDYELTGTDARVRLLPGTTVSAELARSTSELARQSVSTNGGLSFTTLTGANDISGNAWTVRLDSSLGATQLEAGYQSIQTGFSNTATLSHQGTDKLSVRTLTRLTPSTDLILQHDTQRLTDDGTAETAGQLGAQTAHTSLAQVVQRLGEVALTGEYRHQDRDRPLNAQESSTEDLLAGRVDVPLNDEVTVYAAQQAAVRQPGNTQGTLGLKAQLDDDRSLLLEQTAGNLGNATRLMTTNRLAPDVTTYSSAVWQRDPLRGQELTATSGIAKELAGGGRLYLDDEFRRSSDGPTFGRILGVDTPLTGRWRMSTSVERGQTESAVQDTSHNAWHVAASYANPLKLTARHEAEVRFQDGAANERQVATTHEVKYLPTQDLTLFGRLEYALTRNTQTSRVSARTKELHLGAAYRPIEHDRFNALAQYTQLDDKGSPGQTDVDNLLAERQRLMSLEGAYDLGHNMELVGKLARRDSTELVSGSPPVLGSTYQWLTRLNYHLTDAWDLGIEHRILRTRQAEDIKQGFSVELDRTIWKLFQVGVGYHFTKYTEDITHADDFKTNRWFLRLAGKYASWTPEELARQEQLQRELMREALIWRFANEWLLAHEPETADRLAQLLAEGEAALVAENPELAESLYQQAQDLARDVRERARIGLDLRMQQEDELAAWVQEAHAAMDAGDEPRAAELYDRVIRGVSALR